MTLYVRHVLWLECTAIKRQRSVWVKEKERSSDSLPPKHPVRIHSYMSGLCMCPVYNHTNHVVHFQGHRRLKTIESILKDFKSPCLINPDINLPPTSLWTFAILCSALKLRSVVYITVWFNCFWKATLERLLKTFFWMTKNKCMYPFSQRKPREQAFFAVDYICWAGHRRNHRCWHWCGRLRWTLKPIVSLHFLSLLYFFLPLLLSALPPPLWYLALASRTVLKGL